MAGKNTKPKTVAKPAEVTGAAPEAKPAKTVEQLEKENALLKQQLEVAQTEGATDDENIVPVKWVKAVHEILGEDFDCERVEPDNGGTLFKIIVPREKSNAPQMHWEMHKRDVRTREIGNTGITGVKEWCLKVRANLIASGQKLVQYP